VSGGADLLGLKGIIQLTCGAPKDSECRSIGTYQLVPKHGNTHPTGEM
jgi:hypothetical protein